MSLLLLFSGSESAFIISDATHGHLADSVALTAVSVLSVQDAQHGHLADNVGVLAVAQLVIQDATHGGTMESDLIYVDFKPAKKMSTGKYIKI